jgi:hypothetical protein
LKTANISSKTRISLFSVALKNKKLPHTLQQKIPAFKKAKFLSPKISNEKKKMKKK